MFSGIVLGGGCHGFGQIVYAEVLVFVNAGDFRKSIIDLVTVVLILFVIQHFVELLCDGVTV